MPKLPPYSRRAYPASGKGRYSRRGTYPSSRRYISKGKRGFQRTGGEYRFAGRTGMGGRGVKAELKWKDVPHVYVGGATIWKNMVNQGVVAPPYEPNSWLSDQTILLIDQGSGSQQRIGRKVLVKSVNVDLNFVPAFGATIVTGNKVSYRVMLVWDKQCNGTPAQVSDLFAGLALNPGDGNAQLSGQTCSISFPMNIPNNLRFQILKTWEGTKIMDNNLTANFINLENTSVSSLAAFRIHGYKKVNIPIEYGDAGQNIGLIRSNNLFVCVCWTGLEAEAGVNWGNNYFSICGNVRVRYTDV